MAMLTIYGRVARDAYYGYTCYGYTYYGYTCYGYTYYGYTWKTRSSSRAPRSLLLSPIIARRAAPRWGNSRTVGI